MVENLLRISLNDDRVVDALDRLRFLRGIRSARDAPLAGSRFDTFLDFDKHRRGASGGNSDLGREGDRVARDGLLSRYFFLLMSLLRCRGGGYLFRCSALFRNWACNCGGRNGRRCRRFGCRRKLRFRLAADGRKIRMDLDVGSAGDLGDERDDAGYLACICREARLLALTAAGTSLLRDTVEE